MTLSYIVETNLGYLEHVDLDEVLDTGDFIHAFTHNQHTAWHFTQTIEANEIAQLVAGEIICINDDDS